MARLHGKNGLVLMEPTAGAGVTTVVSVWQWSMSFSADYAEETAITDVHKMWMATMQDAQGSFDGFLDDSGPAQEYLAARDGQARLMELYPDHTEPFGYTGLVLPTYSAGGVVADAIRVHCDWVSQSSLALIGGAGTYGAVYSATY